VYYMVSKTAVVILVLVAVLLFLVSRKVPPVLVQVQETPNFVPRARPVYIDQPTVYFNQPITYTEWDREISSSL
jgi:hypothetical protein